jgi:hypothetical protein
VGNIIFLKVKAIISSLKLRNCSKLVAKYCGPFEILERIGPIAYVLEFSTCMTIHNIFHVSFLKKYILDSNHVIYFNVIQVEKEHTLQVHLVHILDRKKKETLELIHKVCKGPVDMVRS